MSEQEIHKILVKYLGQEANAEELDKLDLWLRDEKNIPIFNRYIKTQYLSAICMGNYDLDKARKSIDTKVKKYKKKQRIVMYSRFAMAASVALLIGVLLFVQNNGSIAEKVNVVEKEHNIVVGSDKAVLTLGDGKHVTLEEGKQYNTNQVSSNGQSLLYRKKEQAKTETEYNYLTIPRGGQFFVQLSDGTMVWLNSESKLKFPVNFDADTPRVVELVYGEAYFDVTPSSENNGNSFIVHTQAQDIEVLGTEFNISAYQNSKSIQTALVEGRVRVTNGISEETLFPGSQAVLDIETDRITIEEVDLTAVTAWKDGLFMFNEKRLEEMLIVLGRWYDFEYEFVHSEKRDLKFSGVLKRRAHISELLTKIERTEIVKFEMNNGKITVK